MCVFRVCTECVYHPFVFVMFMFAHITDSREVAFEYFVILHFHSCLEVRRIIILLNDFFSLNSTKSTNVFSFTVSVRTTGSSVKHHFACYNNQNIIINQNLISHM